MTHEAAIEAAAQEFTLAQLRARELFFETENRALMVRAMQHPEERAGLIEQAEITRGALGIAFHARRRRQEIEKKWQLSFRMTCPRRP